MKLVSILAIMALLPAALMGEEFDNEVISVRTGWTQEKASFEHTWMTLSELERQTEIRNLEKRIEQLLHQLPADQYSPEEGIYVGYQSNLLTLLVELKNNPSAANYAELAALVNEADHFIWYIERERTLPQTLHEEPSIFEPLHPSGHEEGFRQGYGWFDQTITSAYTDHATPSVAALGDTVFVACGDIGDGTDTVFLYRSLDGGMTWGLWYTHGTATSDRYPFDLAIDPENHYLYLSYGITSASMTGNIWIRRFTDFNDSSATNIYGVETGTDACHQPHLSVEHEYSTHRLCVMYYNQTTGNMVIAQSTDLGSTWTTTHTTTWTVSAGWPKPKGCQGAESQTTDKFFFVAQKDANSFVIFESTSGLPGSFTETEYTHSYDVDAVDISVSHNYNARTVVVSFGYLWTATDYNVRAFFRSDGASGFVSQLVDGDGLMTKTPVISVDREWDFNHSEPDYFHIAYYKDHNADTNYIPMASRCLNDSTLLDGWDHRYAPYFEMIGDSIIDTLVTASDYGNPMFFYQLDITTLWNTTASQWFPAIAFMRLWDSSPYDHDPHLAIPDPSITGISGSIVMPADRVIQLMPNPSRDFAEISFMVGKAGNVHISVYDAMGRLVNTILDGNKPIGEHSTRLDARNLSSGIYFIRIETPEAKVTAKLTLIR